MAKDKKRKHIYIGTSGWSYDWPDFYSDDVAKKDWLNFYSNVFNSVEINYSFYRLPSEITYRKWFSQTTKNFLFALKLSRYITHTKRLDHVKSALKKFIKRAAIGLEYKLGPILVQLPENFQVNINRLKKFLQITTILDRELKAHNKYAFEFRHKSWFNSIEVIRILQQYNAAFVFSHSPKFAYPTQEHLTTDFVYIRMHGPEQLYASSYSTEDLKKWAEKIIFWFNQDKSIFVYFNNDAYGYAPENAKTLLRLLGQNYRF